MTVGKSMYRIGEEIVAWLSFAAAPRCIQVPATRARAKHGLTVVQVSMTLESEERVSPDFRHGSQACSNSSPQGMHHHMWSRARRWRWWGGSRRRASI